MKKIISVGLCAIIVFSLVAGLIPVSLSQSGLEKKWNEGEKTLTIINNSLSSPEVLKVRQVSINPDIDKFEEVFEIKPVNKDYEPCEGLDFMQIYENPSGIEISEKITSESWSILENVSYNVTIHDYGYEDYTETNVTVEEVNSTVINVTNNVSYKAYENGSVPLDGSYKYIYDSHTNTSWEGLKYQRIGDHEEIRYKDVYNDLNTSMTFSKGETYKVKLTLTKEVVKGFEAILVIPTFKGFKEKKLTWWNTTWGSKRPIQIDNTGNSNDLSYYQVYANISYDADMNSDFSDIRVVNESADATVPYWIENKVDSEYAEIWLKATNIPASSWLNNTYYLYYDNPDASSVSNVTDTFIREINSGQPVNGSWHLDESSGTTAYDTSGNDNDGDVVGANWADGKFVKALDFDGSDDYVGLGFQNQPSQFTWEGWINVSAFSGDNDAHVAPEPLVHSAGSDNDAFSAGFDNNGYLYYYTSGDDEVTNGIGANAPYSTDTWLHYAIVIDQSNTLTIYIDGTEEFSISMGTIDAQENNWQIGGDGTGNNRNFLDGKLDEVLLYNRTLSAEEITDIYNNYGYTTTNYPGRTLVRKYASPEPDCVLGSEEENVAISISDGSIAFGDIELSSQIDTIDTSDTQTVNTSGASRDQQIEIKLNDTTITGATNGTTLTIVSTEPGENEIRTSFKGGDATSYTAITGSYQNYSASMAADTTDSLDIRLTTPSTVSSDDYYDDYQYEILMRATLL